MGIFWSGNKENIRSEIQTVTQSNEELPQIEKFNHANELSEYKKKILLQEQQVQLLLNLHNDLNKWKAEFKLKEKKDCLLICGARASGKSTMWHSLQGHKLILEQQEQQKDNENIEFKYQIEEIQGMQCQIAHGKTGTQNPNKVEVKTSSEEYDLIDLPGYFDPNDSLVLMHHYQKRFIMQSYENFKVIFMTKEENFKSVRTEAENFEEQWKNLTKYFEPENQNQSMLIVIRLFDFQQALEDQKQLISNLLPNAPKVQKLSPQQQAEIQVNLETKYQNKYKQYTKNVQSQFLIPIDQTHPFTEEQLKKLKEKIQKLHYQPNSKRRKEFLQNNEDMHEIVQQKISVLIQFSVLDFIQKFTNILDQQTQSISKNKGLINANVQRQICPVIYSLESCINQIKVEPNQESNQMGFENVIHEIVFHSKQLDDKFLVTLKTDDYKQNFKRCMQLYCAWESLGLLNQLRPYFKEVEFEKLEASLHYLTKEILGKQELKKYLQEVYLQDFYLQRKELKGHQQNLWDFHKTLGEKYTQKICNLFKNQQTLAEKNMAFFEAIIARCNQNKESRKLQNLEQYELKTLKSIQQQLKIIHNFFKNNEYVYNGKKQVLNQIRQKIKLHQKCYEEIVEFKSSITQQDYSEYHQESKNILNQILNLDKLEESFGRLEVQINYLKDLIDKILEFNEGPKWYQLFQQNKLNFEEGTMHEVVQKCYQIKDEIEKLLQKP